MRTKSKSRLSLLFMSFALMLALPAMAFADQLANNIDDTLDGEYEAMALETGGKAKEAKIYIVATDDAQNNCNLNDRGEKITVRVTSSATSVATARWTDNDTRTIDFTGCGKDDGKMLKVTSGDAASEEDQKDSILPAEITFDITFDNTDKGNFTVNRAQFKVFTTKPSNNAPTVSVTGVQAGASYEVGSVPTAGCSVADAEDTNESATPVVGAVTGPLSAYGIGSQTVTCSYTDGGGLTEIAKATYSINDTTAPRLTLPADITKEATTSSGATANFSASANDAVYGNVSVSCSPASGSTFALGTTRVNCEATDGSNNTARGSFNVTVGDSTAPNTSIESGPEAGSWIRQDGATFTFSGSDSVTSLANLKYSYRLDGGAWSTPGTSDTATLSDLGQGRHTFEVKAIDQAGNEDGTPASRSFGVDTIAPEFSGTPPNVTEEATSSSGARVTYASPSATDNIDGAVAVSCLPASGGTFPLGDTTVRCEASDNAGNTDSVSFKVTVQDTTAPAIAAHTDITGVEATGPDGAKVNYTKPAASDLVDGTVAVNCSPVSGSTFDLGDTTVTCSASDSRGNSSQRTFKVTVVDTTGPALQLPANITQEATGPNGNVVNYSASASDLVDGNRGVNCSPASGSLFPIATTTVNCSASDSRGNASAGSFTVKVQDTIAPGQILFVGNINDGDSFFFGDVPVQPTCSATDGGSGLQSCVVSGHSTAIGTHTLVATATDKAGNSATRTISYTVKAWNFSGFYQPVDMSGTLNTVKGGSTVPIKFELFKGATELTDTASVKALQASKVACDTSATIDDIEILASGSTALRYDATGGQFIYNWKTPTGAGTCYKVTITAADGSSKSALFKLR